MENKKIFVILILLILSALASGFSITELDIEPGNRLYKDDVFNVTAKINGFTCKRGIRFSIDGEKWVERRFYNKCSVKEAFSGNWDLKDKPLTPGKTHVLQVDVLDEFLYPEEGKTETIFIYILDKERPTTSTTVTTTSTTSIPTTSMTSTTTTISTSTSTTTTTLKMTSTSTSITTSITTSSLTTTTTIPEERGIVGQILNIILNIINSIIDTIINPFRSLFNF